QQPRQPFRSLEGKAVRAQPLDEKAPQGIPDEISKQDLSPLRVDPPQEQKQQEPRQIPKGFVQESGMIIHTVYVHLFNDPIRQVKAFQKFQADRSPVGLLVDEIAPAADRLPQNDA